jgi:hypothetical protein
MGRTKRRTRRPEGRAEQRPDAWQRFERAIDAAIKGGPKHRPAKPPKAKRQKKAST